MTPATTRAGTTFQFSGLRVRASSSDPSHLSWLEEFICPQFQVVDEAPDCNVVLTEDSGGYEELLRRGPRPGAPQLDCFALDGGVVALPVWSSPDAERTVFDEKFGVFYVAGPSQGEIGILSAHRNLRARIPLMRVVREFAMGHAQAAGQLALHGSSFAVGDRGVVVAGPSRAGKTTLLIQALRRGGARYLSNDRVLISGIDADPVLRGMPTIVTIRKSTLELFPDLERRLLESSHHHRLTIRETAQRPPRPPQLWEDGRFGLTPAQFCHLLGVAAVAKASARAILLPRVTGERGGIELEPISAQAAADRLVRALFAATSGRRSSDLCQLAGEGGETDPITLERLCHQLAWKVDCFECRMGLDAYDGDPSTAHFWSLLER